VIRAARRRGIALYVPVVIDLPRRRMRFVALSAAIPPGTERARGNLGSLRFIPARWFNLILLPIVGIDADGHRLGMGAGFYDRALAFRRLRRHWKGPRLIALGFDCQRVEQTYAEVWDARLDGLITESGLHLFP
jgi:5-formyltetrahydrofolate cyclo-ligase